MKSTALGCQLGATSACRCISDRSHVTQVASDFPNKLPPSENRDPPETFIDTLLCVYIRTHTGDNGPTWSLFNPFSASLPCRLHESDPTLCSLCHYFPESVYYHRPVSSFMQNNLISRASKSRYNVAPCPSPLVFLLSLSPIFRPTPTVFRISSVFLLLPSPVFKLRPREKITFVKLLDVERRCCNWPAIIAGFRSFDRSIVMVIIEDSSTGFRNRHRRMLYLSFFLDERLICSCKLRGAKIMQMRSRKIQDRFIRLDNLLQIIRV